MTEQRFKRFAPVSSGSAPPFGRRTTRTRGAWWNAPSAPRRSRSDTLARVICMRGSALAATAALSCSTRSPIALCPRRAGPHSLPPLHTDANVTKREESELRRLRSDANVTKREVFQRRTPGGGVLGRLRRCESWAFAGSVTAWSGPCRRKLRVLLHLQHGDGPAGPYLRVLLHLHHATPHRAGCGA